MEEEKDKELKQTKRERKRRKRRNSKEKEEQKQGGKEDASPEVLTCTVRKQFCQVYHVELTFKLKL